MTGILNFTGRGYAAPKGLPEELAHKHERHIIVRISEHELGQLYASQGGMRGKFALMKDYDGDTWELICVERD